MNKYSFIKAGSNVLWIDPDEGISSGIYQVKNIAVDNGEEIDNDTIIFIANSHTEAMVYAFELSSDTSKHYSEIAMIRWDGREYPSKTLTIFQGEPNEEEVLVSTVDLENELLDDEKEEYRKKPEEAEHLDNQIYYYLESEEMQLSDEEIIAILEKA